MVIATSKSGEMGCVTRIPRDGPLSWRSVSARLTWTTTMETVTASGGGALCGGHFPPFFFFFLFCLHNKSCSKLLRGKCRLVLCWC
ncbi:hypothetical protein DM02DRAFT_334510 [Periconia macrospinosa]|uniref:Uncharacterized protein n=1 Tax=Periconia macrospinosa TaxID=97972 RepID=A0A2V1DUG1_9PLEO|nr:hypothetical protein DM02DRAFT_334510 [Periconia macrospinosa]